MAALKAELRITPAQEPAWATYTAALQPGERRVDPPGDLLRGVAVDLPLLDRRRVGGDLLDRVALVAALGPAPAVPDLRAQEVEREVAGYRRVPGLDRRVGVAGADHEALAREVGLEQGRLQEVLGGRVVADELVQEASQAGGQGGVELGEGSVVAVEVAVHEDGEPGRRRVHGASAANVRRVTDVSPSSRRCVRAGRSARTWVSSSPRSRARAIPSPREASAITAPHGSTIRLWP